MKTELRADLPFLGVGELTAAAASVVAVHERARQSIKRLESSVALRRKEIAERWRKVPGITEAERSRLMARETDAGLAEIRANSDKELTGLMREAVDAESRVSAQASFYDSPVKLLAREGIGSARRNVYLEQVRDAGPVELAHLAQFAISNKEKELGAAVLRVLDKMPTAERPFGAAPLALGLVGDDYKRAQEAMKVARHRAQEVVNSIRAFRSNSATPQRLGAAIARQSEDGSIDWTKVEPAEGE